MTLPFWKMKMLQNKMAEIYIFGEIVTSGYEWDNETSAVSFKSELDNLGDVETINLHINSPGGSVFEGVAIATMLKQHKASINVYVDGLAASIASVIAMSGDTIFMPKNAMLMLHFPWTGCVGNAVAFRKQADDLDKIGESMKESYLAKAGESLTDEVLVDLLTNETWLSAADAIQYGLADELLEENKIAASVSESLFKQYKNIPNTLKNLEKSASITESLTAKKLRIIKGD